MTRDEVKKIIMVIATTYPNWKPENMTNTVDVWYTLFADYPASLIQKALKEYICRDTKGFAPVPGQIIANIPLEGGYLNEQEAWDLVYKAICNSGYHSKEEFEKLPPECQKAAGSANNLKELALMDIETVQSVEKSHFIRTYRDVLKNEIHNKQMMKPNKQNSIGTDRDRKALTDDKGTVSGTAK